MSDSLIASVEPAVAAAAERLHHDGDEHTAHDAWAALERLGLTRIGITEEAGGSGGSLHDLVSVLVIGARHALPLPLGETYLASRLLELAGRHVPDGMLTVAPPRADQRLQLHDGRIRGTAPDTPWGATAHRFVGAADAGEQNSAVISVEPGGCAIRAGENLAGEPIATLTVDTLCQPDELVRVDRADHFWRGALVRTAQIVGALEAVSTLTLRYAQQREQFGRPIARFQAVQAHLVAVAQAVELARTSLWRAVLVADDDETATHFEVAAAKLLANECAETAARAAHQAHGAIGLTREYPLAMYTRRLNVWRKQWGTNRQLAAALGAAAVRQTDVVAELTRRRSGLAVPCPIR